jgi:hypothetical protein
LFLREDALTQLDVSPEQMLVLLISINTPMVALEDRPTEEAEATICTVRRESDMVSTYVHLAFKHSGGGVFYRYESDLYPEDLRGPVESAALSFAESLGFIMDDKKFDELDPDARKTLLERAIFTGPRSPASAAPPETFPVPEEGASLLDSMEEDPSLDPLGEINLPGETPGTQEASGALAAESTARATSPVDAEITLEEEADEDLETDLDRAIEQFMGPLVAPAAPLPDAPQGRALLSRFRKRPAGADIYAIHGLPRAAPDADTPRDAAAGAAEPAAAPAAVATPTEDPEVRARRAKARFLASF